MGGDLTRQKIIESGLPILDSLYAALNKGDGGGYQRFCLLGPTREEVDAHAPRLSQEFVSPRYPEYRPLLLPLDSKTELLSLLDAQWRWAAEHECISFFTMLIMPPDFDVVSALPRDQKKFPREVLKGASSGLLLFQLLSITRGDLAGVAIMPDQDLRSEQSRGFRFYLSERYIEGHTRRAQGIRRSIQTMARAVLRTPKLEQSREQPAKQGTTGIDWSAGFRGADIPRFVWAFAPRGNIADPDDQESSMMSVVGLCDEWVQPSIAGG